MSAEELKKHPDKKNYAQKLSNYTQNKYDATPGSAYTWQIRGARGYESNWTVKKGINYINMKYRSVIFKDIFYEIWVLGNCEEKDLDQFLQSVAIDK